MALPTDLAPLGAGTLVRDWKIDVNTGTDAVPTWVRVKGIGGFKSSRTNSMQDDTDFDSDGAKSATATAYEWTVEFTVMRKKTSAGTAYDAGQEVLRLASLDLGVDNRVPVRFYKMGSTEAYAGSVAVDWTDAGGNPEDDDTAEVKLMGQGARSTIAHPSA